MEHQQHHESADHGTGHHSEESRIHQLIKAQVDQLLHKRKEVLSKVQTELDDIDRALHQLGYESSGAHSSHSPKQKRRARISDDEIKNLLKGFMHHGTHFSGADILKKNWNQGLALRQFQGGQQGLPQNARPQTCDDLFAGIGSRWKTVNNSTAIQGSGARSVKIVKTLHCRIPLPILRARQA